MPQFHNATGQGYEFLADIIIQLNKINPQIAAGLSKQFNVLGYKMYYPADSKFGAPVELIVNCRCTTIYHNKRITRKA